MLSKDYNVEGKKPNCLKFSINSLTNKNHFRDLPFAFLPMSENGAGPLPISNKKKLSACLPASYETVLKMELKQKSHLTHSIIVLENFLQEY